MMVNQSYSDYSQLVIFLPMKKNKHLYNPLVGLKMKKKSIQIYSNSTLLILDSK